MKVAKALAGTAATGLLVVGLAGTASAASQVQAAPAASCSTSKVSNYTARGWCSSGTTWRLGIRCSNGQYDWTAWYSSSRTTSITCSGGYLTHYWIDQK